MSDLLPNNTDHITENTLVDPASDDIKSSPNTIQKNSEDMGASSEQNVVSVEEEARKEGWRPKEEFHDSENWVGAKEYLYRRKLMNKIHTQTTEMKRMNQELSIHRRNVENIEKVIMRREELAAQHERENIVRERREAIQNGDVEAVERLDEKISTLPSEIKKENAGPLIPPETQEWTKRHASWFNKNSEENTEMMEYAAWAEKHVYRNNPDIAVSDALREIEKEVRQKFPHRFRNPNVERRQEVESAGEYTAPRKNKIDQSKITPVLRDIAQQFVRKGLYKTTDEYYKDYFGV